MDDDGPSCALLIQEASDDERYSELHLHCCSFVPPQLWLDMPHATRSLLIVGTYFSHGFLIPNTINQDIGPNSRKIRMMMKMIDSNLVAGFEAGWVRQRCSNWIEDWTTDWRQEGRPIRLAGLVLYLMHLNYWQMCLYHLLSYRYLFDQMKLLMMMARKRNS